MITRRFLVAFEGSEGSGKTTQSKILLDSLQKSTTLRDLFSEGFEYTKTPGTTNTGKKIRSIFLDEADTGMSPETEEYLALADLSQFSKELFDEYAEDSPAFVIIDRYIGSKMVYACGRDTKWIVEDNLTHINLPSPNLTFFLEVPEFKVGLDRANKVSIRGERRIDQKDSDYHESIQRYYREWFEGYTNGEKYKLDSSLSLEEVSEKIRMKTIKALSDRFHIDYGQLVEETK